MNNKLNAAERTHLARIKSLPCSVCGRGPPSDAHHIVQGQQYTTIPLCRDCHQGSKNGWHGERRMWTVMRKDEMTCLNDTVRKLLCFT